MGIFIMLATIEKNPCKSSDFFKRIHYFFTGKSIITAGKLWIKLNLNNLYRIEVGEIMEIREVGEFGLIDQIKENTIYDQASVLVGIGDDAAVTVPTPQRLQLLTTDMLVESVHFDLTSSSPYQLGYKAVAVNFSDIAAMGGKPKHVLVSIAIPSYVDVEFITKLYDGMKSICQEFGANLVGGDTVSTPGGLVINVAVTGEVMPEDVVRRSGAKVGHVVAVTGTLGDSALGLKLTTMAQWPNDDESALVLINRHLMPKPQVLLGQKIAQTKASSMNDISDGLASELNEIAKASHVGMHIEEKLIPISKESKKIAAALNINPYEAALYGGEDFQLVFTIDREKLAQLQQENPELSLTLIGEVVAETGVTLLRENQRSALEPKGYNHFR